MKRFLILSLFANAALAIAVIVLSRQQPSQSELAPVGGTKPAPVKAAPVAQDPVAAAAAPAEPARPVPLFDWRMVESEDYKKYIANLRAIGCPEETIRDIITADVNKLFESRRRSLVASTNKFQYWKSGNIFGDMMNPERIEKTQELAKEKRALLKELLGVEPEEKPEMFGGINPFETMLDFLSPSQQNDVMNVFMKYQAKVAKFAGSGSMDAEDMKQLKKIQKEMDAELAAMLSPQEFLDYQLRMSDTAMSMRSQLSSFNPSEQEFLDIFKIKKKFDDDFSTMGVNMQNGAEREKYQAAKGEMDAQLKGLLGESRFAEYERSQDWEYQNIYKITDRNGLPKDSAVKVYDMRKVAMDQANKVRNDRTLTPEQRNAALKGIRTETENSMRSVLGDTAWKSYQSQPNTYWLRNISPDPAPAQ